MNTLDPMAAGSRSGSTKWEDLRRQARHIEQDLDVKLVSFSKLGSSTSDNRSKLLHSLDFDNEDKNSIGSPTLKNKVNNDDMFKTMSIEISSLLKNLETINQQLSDFSQQNSMHSNGSSFSPNNSAHGNAAMLHTLQRHRDIFQDFQHEYNKVKSNIEAQRQREDLLGSVRRDIDLHYRQQQQLKNRNSSNGLSNNTAVDGYMKERERLLNSDRLTHEAIEIAQNTRESLHEQKQNFKNMSSKIGNIMTKFPMINSLVHRINWRKKRDSLILSAVISVCLFFIIMYWLRL